MTAAAPAGPSAPVAFGAYGFSITGLHSTGADAGLLEVPASDGWPPLHVGWRHGTAGRPAANTLADDEAVVLMVEGEYATLDRRRGTVVFHANRALDDDTLVHPYLAGPAAVMAQWHGRLALHAGAVVVDGGAWAVLGAKGAGKTTTMAALHAHGYDIVTDDLLVVDGAVCFAGPRSLDLRPDAAELLGVGARVRTVRGGERERLALPLVAAEVPFRGCILLEAGDRVEVELVRVGDRLRLLADHVVVGPHGHARLLDLLAMPVRLVRRPRTWAALEHTVAALETAMHD